MNSGLSSRVQTKLHIALPMKDEWENAPRILDCLRKQSERDFKLWICVNQPDEWWHKDDLRVVCERNIQTIEYLKEVTDIDIEILDYASPSKGWKGKKEGIGWARKVLMDKITENAKDSDIMVSMDADSYYPEAYLNSIINVIESVPKAIALSNPYYHELSDDDVLNRAMLHYELYMRYYTINLWRIQSPYTFTALGSSMAFKVDASKKIGGISPKKSGEDFYLLQQFAKVGLLLHYNEIKVFPGTRYSNRVYFGTGPALIKGKSNQWESYPFYPTELFNELKEMYAYIPKLFKGINQNQLPERINTFFNIEESTFKLLKNYKNMDAFVNAFHVKFDGLRILQYLKSNHLQSQERDNENLILFLKQLGSENTNKMDFEPDEISLQSSSIDELNKCRNFLATIEDQYRYKHYMKHAKKQ